MTNRNKSKIVKIFDFKVYFYKRLWQFKTIKNMKRNSKITIFLSALVLIIWISFLFIEQDKTFSKDNDIITNKNIENKISTNKNTEKEIITIKELSSEKEKTTEKTQEIKEKETIIETNNNTKNIIKPEIIPSEYDIQNVSFFSQAPYWNWNQPYQDACEEASLLIWQYYIKWIKKTRDEYNKDLLAMVELEMEMLWYFESTTIMEMKQIINRRDPSITARIIEHPTIRDLEREISKNNMVIAPLYGKWLKNPHYALWGPEYHFLVIKWYTQDSFITHDVWTLHWANRNYNKNLIMENIHDRNRIDVQKWAARVLILEK